MGVHLGGGWHLHHLTDRVIELRKEDHAYRQLIGRDGYVRVRGEPGMDRRALLEKAVAMAQRNDARLAEMVAQQIVPKRLGGYQMKQQQWGRVMATPEDEAIIGRKSA